MRVNTDPIHDGKDQFYQWMTVDPKTGSVYVLFYDRRDDPANLKTGVTLARSTDGGRTFENYAWTDNIFQGTATTFLGDYTWLAAFNNHVYGAWTENGQVPATGDKTAPAPTNQRPANLTIIRAGRADFSSTPGR